MCVRKADGFPSQSCLLTSVIKRAAVHDCDAMTAALVLRDKLEQKCADLKFMKRGLDDIVCSKKFMKIYKISWLL